MTVQVVERKSNAPIQNADVFQGPYRCTTDERGLAALHVPAGEYQLLVNAPGMQVFQTSVAVAGDLAVTAELEQVVEEYGYPYQW